MGFEWDVGKAQSNLRKHHVSFPEAITALENDFAITFPDEASDVHEARYVTFGMGGKQKLLAVVYCFREQNIRIISARKAEPHERELYEDKR